MCSLYRYVVPFCCFKWIARHASLTLGGVDRIKRRICLKSVVLPVVCKMPKLPEEMREEEEEGGHWRAKVRERT